MPNNYCRLPHVKADEAGLTVTTMDAVLDRAIEQASREFDMDTENCILYALAGQTRYFHRNANDPRKLWVGELLSPGTVGVDWDRDGVYELTLVEGTDYFQGPEARDPGWPYQYLYLMPYTSQIITWPAHERAVKLSNATFGFSNETEAVVASGTPVTGTVATTSGLVVTASVDVSALLFAGDTLVIEDEQMPVASVATTAITVASRGLNGTTAAAHTAKALNIRRFPRHVERVVAERVVSGRWDSQGGYQGADGGTTNRAIYARWKQAANSFREMVVV